jgi:hypothetical protein
MLYSATFPVTVKAFKEKFLRWVVWGRGERRRARERGR